MTCPCGQSFERGPRSRQLYCTPQCRSRLNGRRWRALHHEEYNAYRARWMRDHRILMRLAESLQLLKVRRVRDEVSELWL